MIKQQYRKPRFLCIDLGNWSIPPHNVKAQEVQVIWDMVLHFGSHLGTFSLLVCAARLHH